MSLSHFLLVLLSGFLHASWNTLAKKTGKNITILWLGTSLVGLAVLPFVLTSIPSHLLKTSLLWGILSGVVHIFYYLALTHAYYHYPLSHIYPISRGLGIVGASVFGIIALKDTLSFLGALAIVVVLSGIALYFYDSKTNQKSQKSVLWGCIVGLSIALYLITDILAIRYVNASSHVILLFLTMNICLLPYFIFKHKKEMIEGFYQHKKNAIAIGACALFSYALILIVLRSNPVSYVLSLRECSIVISALFSVWILKEKISFKKGIAILCICIGAIILKIS
ncbi:hypothetical protein DID78_05760 [Candidatus Marinamargulisbacteria bacterium SCGC AG-343-D04]|nr:hypothetical protein DID78_05760 [Candidatus Marinamargulisbacteria bacterium SCGC AG-343-D04]